LLLEEKSKDKTKDANVVVRQEEIVLQTLVVRAKNSMENEEP
jgi:hypothetical protein